MSGFSAITGRRVGSTWLGRVCLAMAAVLFAASAAPAQVTTNYTYDALGRLTASTVSNGAQAAYTYDAADNRTQLITAQSQVPVVGAVNVTVNSNTTNDPITLNFSPTNGAATSVAVSTQASHGIATPNGLSITYTPTTGWPATGSSSDSFQYTATNSYGTSTPATVNVTVNASVPNGTVLYTKSTSGSFSYTIPAGVAFVTIEGWGSGGSGGSMVIVYPASIPAGGGGGGYFKKHIAVTQGQVISGAVGALYTGATTVSSPSLTANGGGCACSVVGTGGTATGGDTNTSGSGGGTGNTPYGGGAGNGGGNQNTANGNGTSPGGGGAGTTGAGANGKITITAVTS